MAKKPPKPNTPAPKGSYAIPATKTEGAKYPVDTIAHARNALSRVGQHGTPEQKAKVYAKVKREYPELAKRSTVVPKRKPK